MSTSPQETIDLNEHAAARASLEQKKRVVIAEVGLALACGVFFMLSGEDSTLVKPLAIILGLDFISACYSVPAYFNQRRAMKDVVTV